jgi:hypothetical protein
MWDSRTYNASGVPTFAYSSDGRGTVYFTTAAESPCSERGNYDWLACASNWGSLDFRIYIREFAASGKPSWVWNQTGGCGTGETCWDLNRSLIHELIHVTMNVWDHDESGEDDTVMSEIQIAKPTAGWDTNHLQRCDEATAQLLYGLYADNARLSGCMNQVADTPLNGLTTRLTLDRESQTACTSSPVTIKGLLRTGNYPSYMKVANIALAGRTIYIYRRVLGATTWPTTPHKTVVASTADDWNISASLAAGTTTTYEYKFDFPESDLDPANRLDEGLAGHSDIVTISWRTNCPI